MKNTLLAILIIIVIGLGAYTISKNRAVAPSTNNNNQGQQQAVAASHCGLTVNSPLPGDTVTFPLTINATVDNTQAQSLGCAWTVFEAQAGPVEVLDQNGNVVAMVPLSTTSDWMTSNATQYSATITSISNPAYTGRMTLKFTEDNPSGGLNPDTLTVAVAK